VAQLLGWKPDDVRRVLARNEHVASLDAPLEIDPLLSIGESILDDSTAAPDAHIVNDEITAQVREWLTQLPDKQRAVIERRYGLNGEDVCTLEQLAGILGLTRERVRQIQIEALASLRRILLHRGLSKEGLL
jgi:RNA polymerase nonessential primary-like sigma factor